ncbi:hypothetical protein LXL04_020350 [Taraxacum kok-saghyz]
MVRSVSNSTPAYSDSTHDRLFTRHRSEDSLSSSSSQFLGVSPTINLALSIGAFIQLTMPPKPENPPLNQDHPDAGNPIAALHAHMLHIAQLTTDTNNDWFKYLANNRLLGTWQEFSRALELRFGPSTYENHQATLFKLHQTSTVSVYQSEFEKLSNRVTGLGTEALLNCFLSGLRSDIQNELAVHHPTSLHQAYGLAKLVEDKLHASLQPLDGIPDPPPTKPPLLAAPPQPTPPLPIKKLSPIEMQKHRAEGLCYNCPATYQPGHQCNPPKFLLLQSTTAPPWPDLQQNDFGLEDKAIF